MIRSAVVVFCVVCIATLCSQILGLAFLWSRGQLSRDNLNEIRAVLRGEDRNAPELAETPDARQPSIEEVIRGRAMSILELESREQELAILKSTVITGEDRLIAERKLFEQREREFEKGLTTLRETTQSAATEQARAILKALSPQNAANSLMQIELDEAVVLLKGLAEKDIARILKELQGGPAPQQERAQQLFEAIAAGEPEKSLIERTAGNDARDENSTPIPTTAGEPAT